MPHAERSGHQRRICVLAFGMALLSGASILAHDMWIEPTTFLPDPGEIIGVKLRVGQDFMGDPLPRDSGLLSEFIVEDAAGRKPVVGRDGSDPAGFVRAGAPGLLVVGYHSKPSSVDMTAEKFNQYLKEEGLDQIAAERARRSQTTAGARDLFTRCAKSLIWTGVTSDIKGDRRLGFTLELVAERNPYTIRAGEDLPVRLTYDNHPLAGALVVAMNRANTSERVRARTDRDGLVRLRVAPAGWWLVKAVHMVAAPAGSHADWASYWASLTFGPSGSTAAAR
jgi:Domain of unknown function (DUF4198)